MLDSKLSHEKYHSKQNTRTTQKCTAVNINILDNISSAVLIFSIDPFNIIYLNEAFQKHTGYTLADIKNSTENHLSCLFRDANNNSIFQVSRKFKHNGSTCLRKIFTLTCKDNQIRRVDLALNKYEIENELAIIACFDDISESPVSSEHQQKFQTIFDENPSMYFIINKQGYIISVNRYGASQLGYKPHELEGKHVKCVIHSDDISFVTKQINQCVIHLKSICQWNFRKTKKDGSIIWVEDTARAIQDENGDIIIMIVCKDITSLVQTNTKLTNISFAFQSASDAIAITNSSAEIIYANKAFKKLVLPDKCDNVDIGIAELFDDNKIYASIFRETIQKNSWNGELKINCVNNRKLDVLLRTNLIMNNVEKNQEIVWFFTDISDRIEFDQKLNMLKEKTAFVEKNAIIGQFTSNIMHEINNPLHIILGKLYLLQNNIKDMTNDEKFINYIEKVKEQVYRINVLVRNTQNFSKTTKNLFKSLDINTVIDKSLTSIETRLNDRIEINKYYQNNLPTIMGDEINLGLALGNIILNSIESFKKNGFISIFTTRIDNTINVRIEDNSIGIKDEDLNKLFEPFAERISVSKSNILGLAIAKDIIEKHNGEIRVESQINKGTSFNITFPFNHVTDKGGITIV